MNGFETFLTGIRWQDIADILLNGYIAFRLYSLFRKTRVFKLILVLLILWFFQRICMALGLVVASWSTQGIIVVTAFVGAVVFGNEIRSVFEAKTVKALLWSIPGKRNEAPVEIISESMFELASKHIGALVVIPGKDRLRNLVHSGISWEGKISGEMIRSIFWRNNPVHDGAAVIRGDRITEVSVILPLTERKDLPSYYGTRHRAALGLTEMSDAMVIASSEERGVVAVATGRTMRAMHSRKELEEELNRHLGSSDTGVSIPKRQIIKETGIVLTCIFLAAIVWFGITRGLAGTMITLEAPVEYINRDPAMDIIATSVNNVRLHLSGSEILVRSVRPEQVHVRVDMRNARIGFNEFKIKEKNIILPPGIMVAKIDPPNIEMEIDVTVTRLFPIQVNWKGKLDDSLILKSVGIYPPRVRLIGNIRVLNDISTVYTEPVNLEEIKASGKRVVSPAITASDVMIPPDSRKKFTIMFLVEKRLNP